MKKKIQRRMLYGGLLILPLIWFGYLAESAKLAHAADTAAKGPGACLACHGGSFDKLAAKKASYKAPSGETINPHMYVPHDEKKPENVQDCTNCHSPHPIPLKEKINLTKVSIDNCYLSCHHQQNFERCDKCHRK